MAAPTPIHFFLGAHTPRGYVARIDQLDDGAYGRKVILKGGPGTGKSTLIERVAEMVAADSREFLRCPVCPDSYDGVILRRGDARAVVFDGTPPHTIEPKYPGLVETTINLGDCLCEDALLPHREELITLIERESELTARIHRFLGAAGSLLLDTARLAQNAVDEGKLSRFVDRVCKRELTQGGGACERVRFYTALTADGVVTAGDSPGLLCDRIFLIDDEYGAVSRLMLSELRKRALDAAYEVITCYCPMAPFDKIDHLFIPEAGVGFMTNHRLHPTLTSDLRHINSRRFMNMEALGLRRQRVSFNRKAITELLLESARLFSQAKEAHDEAERHFRRAMDYDAAEGSIRRAAQAVEKMLVCARK